MIKRKPWFFIILICSLLFFGGNMNAYYDRATIYQGVAKIAITNAKPFKEGYWLVDFAIMQSLDTLVSQKAAGKPLEVRILNKPFFKGEVKDISVKCTKGVCEFLEKVDFSIHNIHAMVFLTVFGPDANYIDYIQVINSGEIPPMIGWDITGLKSVPIMQIIEKKN